MVKKIITSKHFALTPFFLFLISCSTQQGLTASLGNPFSLFGDKQTTTKLSEWSCETLVEKAKDEKFALKGLAALQAKRKCSYTFDPKSLSDIERRIYAEEIAIFDPLTPVSAGSLSIDDLKTKIKTAELPADKFKAYKQLRLRQKNLGRRNDFLKTTADMFNWTKAELKKKKTPEARTLFYESAQLFSRTYWTEDKMSKAEDVLSNALRQLKGTMSVAEIYYIQARMAEEKGDLERAVQLYDLTLEDMKEHNPKALSFTMDRLLWIKSWILYKENKWAEAEKSFKNLADTTTELSEKSRAHFFQARCLNKLEKKDEAKALLEKVTQEDFFGYYGLVAYHELGRKLPALSKITYEKKFPFDLELKFLAEPEKAIFQDLIKYQELSIAERAVLVLSKGPESHVNLGLYLADKGKRYLPLFAAFGKLSNEARTEVLINHGDLLYPQPYSDQVKVMAEKTSLPSSLIYSIMKQESAFNEKTRSHADALGLMQMIPRLAKQLSKKFSIEYKNPEDLYKPEINIQLGSYELMEQVRKQSGQLTYVAAAYNAGPGALNNWLRTRNRADMLEFIEEIPYEETRTYVKLIARNKLFYERISKRDEEHPFPPEFLFLIDPKKDTQAKN